MHREHGLGADRVAWRLGARTRVLALGAAVGLHLHPQEGIPAGVGPCYSSRLLRSFHSWRPHIGASACRHLDPAAPEAHHQRAGHAVHCRVRVLGRFSDGYARRHDEASHGAVGDLVDIRRGANACCEVHARVPQRHTLRGGDRLAEDEPAEETYFTLHDDDDDAEDEALEVHDVEDAVPESTGAAVAEVVVVAEVARAERFLYLRCADGRHPPKL